MCAMILDISQHIVTNKV